MPTPLQPKDTYQRILFGVFISFRHGGLLFYTVNIFINCSTHTIGFPANSAIRHVRVAPVEEVLD
jgi:hypothetical protein